MFQRSHLVRLFWLKQITLLILAWKDKVYPWRRNRSTVQSHGQFIWLTVQRLGSASYTDLRAPLEGRFILLQNWDAGDVVNRLRRVLKWSCPLSSPEAVSALCFDSIPVRKELLQEFLHLVSFSDSETFKFKYLDHLQSIVSLKALQYFMKTTINKICRQTHTKEMKLATPWEVYLLTVCVHFKNQSKPWLSFIRILSFNYICNNVLQLGYICRI